MSIFRKYKLESEKYKKQYYPEKTLLKSYLFGFIFGMIIVLPFYIALLSLILLRHDYAIIIGLLLAVSLIYGYLIFFFKDKALEEYVPDVKNINLLFMRIYDMVEISIVCIIIYAIYLIIWW